MNLQAAYEALGLEPGCPLELVKSTYKQVALKTHPDKNPGNPDATARFQRVSEGYNVLLKHLDTSRDDSDDEYDEFDSLYEEEEMAFYMFLFEEMMRGRASRHAHMHFRAREYEFEERETPAEYAERLARSRQEQVEAQERRQRESAARRAQAEMDREREREAAEVRQKARTQAKKAQAQANRTKAQATARTSQQLEQTKRSAVFSAARARNSEKVKKGVWEDSVDAAGGEIKLGCGEFVAKALNDPQETLLHISARNGDKELVEWLDAHSADPEERDSRQFTAFHVALECGHIPVVAYFFEAYEPNDSPKLYDPPEAKTLLSIALDSHEPELVWMILDKGLATAPEINESWTWITSTRGRSAMKSHRKATDGQFEDILKLLMRYGGFTPPPTPSAGESSDGEEQWNGKVSEQKAEPSVRGRSRGRGRGRGRGR
ncbi:DnaJ-domain-containing protein [Mycena amicta]|nr:DnaJ-domain-containing protein [Mycena amicta]